MNKILRQVGGSILLALVSAALVIGGIFLALAESNRPTYTGPSVTDVPAIITFTSQPTAKLPDFQSPLPTLTTIPVTLPVSNTTKTAVPCGPPTGWIRYTVQAGNTMYSLSHAYGVSIAKLQQANCMSSGQYTIRTGQLLWVPNVITRTPLATRTETLTPVSLIFPTITLSPTITRTPTNTPTATETATSTLTATSEPPTNTPTATPTITATPP